MRHTFSKVLLSIIPLLPFGWIQAQQGGNPALIRNVSVFDGERRLLNKDVLLREGKIAAVGANLSVPEQVEVINGEGHTLLPGLIDCHTHSFGTALEDALVFGVTTELDMFTAHEMAANMRSEQAEGWVLNRADLFSAGTPVTAPGGHGTEYGIEIPTISGPNEAQDFVDARIAEGSDYIKIICDAVESGKPYMPTLSKETLAAVRPFEAGEEWQRYQFDLKEFNNTDGHDLMGVLFSGGPKIGTFSFQIDGVRFYLGANE